MKPLDDYQLFENLKEKQLITFFLSLRSKLIKKKELKKELALQQTYLMMSDGIKRRFISDEGLRRLLKCL